MKMEDLKNLLSTGISTGMDVMIDYKFQKELLKKIKYYEKIEHENQQLKKMVNGIREERDYLFNKLDFENQVLIDRIDKAIQHLDCFISDVNLSKYDILKILMHTKKILKGD